MSRVVLIPKGKPDNLVSTSSYRTICILDAMGNRYKILIKERLVAELSLKKMQSLRDNLGSGKAAQQFKPFCE